MVTADEQEEGTAPNTLSDLSSVTLSKHFLIAFRLLTSILLGGNGFCNSLCVLGKSSSFFLPLVISVDFH